MASEHDRKNLKRRAAEIGQGEEGGHEKQRRVDPAEEDTENQEDEDQERDGDDDNDKEDEESQKEGDDSGSDSDESELDYSLPVVDPNSAAAYYNRPMLYPYPDPIPSPILAAYSSASESSSDEDSGSDRHGDGDGDGDVGMGESVANLGEKDEQDNEKEETPPARSAAELPDRKKPQKKIDEGKEKGN